MRYSWVGLAFGALFGFVIAWADLTNPLVIHDMLRLREAYVFLIMGAAIVVAAAGSFGLLAVGARAWLTREPIGWSRLTPEKRHVIGSVIFGVGWSVAGTCPGPVAAMLAVQGALAGKREVTVARIDPAAAGL